jgi:hypothetical protein
LITAIPPHTHYAKFSPESGSGESSRMTGTTSKNVSAWKSYSQPGSEYGDDGTSHVGIAEIENSGDADGNGGCGKNDEDPILRKMIDPTRNNEGANPNATWNVCDNLVVSEAGRDLPSETKDGVVIAPTTYPIKEAHVWERIE